MRLLPLCLLSAAASVAGCAMSSPDDGDAFSPPLASYEHVFHGVPANGSLPDIGKADAQYPAKSTELVAMLEGFFRNEATKDPQPEIHLRPDRRALYDTVARVMAAAQRNRMKRIGFVNTGEFKE